MKSDVEQIPDIRVNPGWLLTLLSFVSVQVIDVSVLVYDDIAGSGWLLGDSNSNYTLKVETKGYSNAIEGI